MPRCVIAWWPRRGRRMSRVSDSATVNREAHFVPQLSRAAPHHVRHRPIREATPRPLMVQACGCSLLILAPIELPLNIVDGEL